MATLVDYIDKLKPVQQEYIVHCVREHGNRPDFHRGLLPFLDAQEAANALNYKLELLKQDAISSGQPVVGIKFVKNIINVFWFGLTHKLCDDALSSTMYLDDKKLRKHFSKRYADKFHIILSSEGLPGNGMARLQRLGRNKWEVTVSEKHAAQLAWYLMDKFMPDH